MSETPLSQALDQLVTVPADAFGDWDDVLSRAGVRTVGRRTAIAATVAIGVVVLFATPAFGLLRDLISRIDVPFTGTSAPLEIKQQFYDLSLGIPPTLAPEAIPSQARKVASFRVAGKTHVLWVAPTRRGGYCWAFTRGLGGCRSVRNTKPQTRTARGFVHPELLGVSFTESRPGQALTSIAGDLLAPNAATLELVYADRTTTRVRFYFVSKPIDAGFFFAAVPAGHSTAKTRAVAVVLRDKAGRVIARQPFTYETPALLARLRARIRTMLKGFRFHPMKPVYSPALPPPTAPLQHGSAEGITATAGANGVVVFDTRGASRSTLSLIHGPHPVGYDCFRKLPFHSAPVGLSVQRTTTAHVAIRVFGLKPPFLGCEIEGTYGHLWPDRLHGHSAVEIPFTAAARTYFVDRAAARDLALFVRSRAMHVIRRSSGAALQRAIQERYEARILSLPSAQAPIAPGRIGFATNPAVTTFVERSATGRRFYVRVAGGRITAQNVKPLGFVF